MQGNCHQKVKGHGSVAKKDPWNGSGGTGMGRGVGGKLSLNGERAWMIG